MKASITTQWRTARVAVLLAASLLGCSKSAPVSQSTVSESQAQADIEFRLNKTQQVRSQIGALEDTIRPFGSVLHDFGKAVDLKVDQHPGTVLGALLDRLSQILQSAVSGMVETRADGSWVLEHPAPLSLNPGQAGTCPRNHIRLRGTQVPGGEQIVIALSSCANSGSYDTLATVLVGVNGTRLVTLSSATFQNLQNQSVSVDPCTLGVDAANNVEFSCTPMTFVSGQQLVSVEHFEFKTDAQGTHAAIRTRLSNMEQGSEQNSQQGTADLVVEPDHPADVRICMGDPSCAR